MTDMTPAQIRSALSAGIISQEQANELLTKAGAAPIGDDSAVIGNEDEMRFIRGFSDIFIAMGVGLLVLGIIIFSASTVNGVPFLIGAAVMFLLAEYFGRRKRQHLPTLVTAVGFMLFVIAGVSLIMGGQRFSAEGNIVAAVISVVAMVLFYMRIKLPFCMALIAISLVYLGFSILVQVFDFNFTVLGLFLLFCGIAILIVALRYDLRDPERMTRYADNAFWLHLVSAPLIIHGLITLFIARNLSDLGDSTAFIVLAIVFTVSVFGLAINRRALLVSSLGYAGAAIAYFVFKADLSGGVALAITLMLLGAAVVFLGAGWDKARGVLIKILPNWKIFPPIRA